MRTKTTCLMTPSTGMTSKNRRCRRFGMYCAGLNANFVWIVSVTFCSIIRDGSIKTESEKMVLQILQYFSKALYMNTLIWNFHSDIKLVCYASDTTFKKYRIFIKFSEILVCTYLFLSLSAQPASSSSSISVVLFGLFLDLGKV